MRRRGDVPSWVEETVRALMRGAPARELYIYKNPSDGNKITRHYREIDCAIERGLSSVCCPAEADIIRRAIIGRVGYDGIYGFPGGRNRFYAIRQRVISAIARELNYI